MSIARFIWIEPSISPGTRVPPEKESDFQAALWFLKEKLLKKRRYANLGLEANALDAIAALAIAEPLPKSLEGRMRAWKKRLRTALDDRAADLANSQKPARLKPVPIQKLPPRIDRKELGYDYKPGKSSKPILFSKLNFDTDQYLNVEDYLGHEIYRLERKRGFEGEQSRLAREEQEAAIERAAETIQLAPILGTAPKICAACAGAMPEKGKTSVILRVDFLRGEVDVTASDVDITSIEVVKVLCDECNDSLQPVPAPTRNREDESWMDRLSEDEKEAWRLRKEGLNQTEIGRKLGKSQGTVSRILKRADAKRQTARAQRLRSTGGA
jgi:RNA polymerase sigma factor (sigma-70 family)